MGGGKVSAATRSGRIETSSDQNRAEEPPSLRKPIDSSPATTAVVAAPCICSAPPLLLPELPPASSRSTSRALTLSPSATSKPASSAPPSVATSTSSSPTPPPTALSTTTRCSSPLAPTSSSSVCPSPPRAVA